MIIYVTIENFMTIGAKKDYRANFVAKIGLF